MRPEPETDALVEALPQWPVRIASEIVVVELACTARRLGGGELIDRAQAIANGLHLIPFSAAIRERAVSTPFNPPLRALDAIHLATALELHEDFKTFIAYDDHMCQAAKAQHLDVQAPH